MKKEEMYLFQKFNDFISYLNNDALLLKLCGYNERVDS